MIKAVIFDNNGVLTTCDNDTTIPAFASYYGVDVEYLRPIFHEVVAPADKGEITTDVFFHRLAESIGKECKPEEIWPFFLECYQSKPEMKELLKKLRADYKIALLTNFVDAFDRINGANWHYENIFDVSNIYVSSKLHLAKPDSRFYQVALDGLGVLTGECVFIDDREENLVPARELGMRTILFQSPQQCENELKLLLERENV